MTDTAVRPYHHGNLRDELLELMFAGKHRDPAGPVRAAGDRAFAVMAELIAEGQANGHLAGTDPEQPGMLVFATMQGLASLVNGGMLDEADIDKVVTGAIHGLMTGLA